MERSIEKPYACIGNKILNDLNDSKKWEKIGFVYLIWYTNLFKKLFKTKSRAQGERLMLI